VPEKWNVGTGSEGGGKFDKGEHEGHLIFGAGVELEEVKTSFNPEGVDAARCAYFGCIDDDLVVEDYLLFGTALVPVFVADAKAGHEVTTGRLVKGRASGSQNAPWLLETPSEEDVALVRKWLDAHATRLKSGRLNIEAAVAAAPAETTPADDDEAPF
jgi:hypothetical protein